MCCGEFIPRLIIFLRRISTNDVSIFSGALFPTPNLVRWTSAVMKMHFNDLFFDAVGSLHFPHQSNPLLLDWTQMVLDLPSLSSWLDEELDWLVYPILYHWQEKLDCIRSLDEMYSLQCFRFVWVLWWNRFLDDFALLYRNWLNMMYVMVMRRNRKICYAFSKILDIPNIFFRLVRRPFWLCSHLIPLRQVSQTFLRRQLYATS